MTETKRTLHFSINGSFITNTAREIFYHQNNLEKAVEIIMGSIQTDQMTPEQRFVIALKIIDGKLKIDGDYPGENYGVFEDNDANVRGIYQHLRDMQEKLDELTATCRKQQDKLAFIAENLSTNAIDELNELWYDDDTPGAKLFNTPDGDLTSFQSDLLKDYLTRARTNDKNNSDGGEDYGWLEPDGTFHPVPWGEHQGWAYQYVKKHFPDVAPLCNTGDCGDILMQRNWILMHSPSLGIARPTYNHEKRITKRQNDFLFQYYMDRDLPEKANQYVN